MRRKDLSRKRTAVVSVRVSLSLSLFSYFFFSCFFVLRFFLRFDRTYGATHRFNLVYIESKGELILNRRQAGRTETGKIKANRHSAAIRGSVSLSCTWPDPCCHSMYSTRFEWQKVHIFFTRMLWFPNDLREVVRIGLWTIIDNEQTRRIRYMTHEHATLFTMRIF